MGILVDLSMRIKNTQLLLVLLISTLFINCGEDENDQAEITKHSIEVIESSNGSVILNEIDVNQYLLQATANEGYYFDQWECIVGDCFNLTNQNPLTIKITQKTTIQPVFLYPIYIHENGITIVAKETAIEGEIYKLNGVEYKLAENCSDFRSTEQPFPITTRWTTICSFKDSVVPAHASSWDTSNVESLEGTFENASNVPNLEAWDTSNVISLRETFKGTKTYVKGLSNWNTSNVTNLWDTFRNGRVDEESSQLGSWDVSKVTYFRSTFWGTLQKSGQFNMDLSKWNTSSATYMQHVFRDNYTYCYDLSSWDVSNVTECINFGLCIYNTPAFKCNSGCGNNVCGTACQGRKANDPCY